MKDIYTHKVLCMLSVSCLLLVHVQHSLNSEQKVPVRESINQSSITSINIQFISSEDYLKQDFYYTLKYMHVPKLNARGLTIIKMQNKISTQGDTARAQTS